MQTIEDRFKEGFLDAVRTLDINLAAWNNPTTLAGFTLLVKSAVLIAGQRLGFGVDAEFPLSHRFDVVFCANGTPRSIQVAVEVENYYETTGHEMANLRLFDAPLGVLITYPLQDLNSLLSFYARIIGGPENPVASRVVVDNLWVRWPQFELPQGGPKGKYLVVFGLRDKPAGDSQWSFHIYRGDEQGGHFVSL